MVDSGNHYMSNVEIVYFEKIFDERRNEKDNTINFNDFKDIVYSHKKFVRSTCSDCLEKIRKAKDRSGGASDN
jgi:hypothetical protein